MKKINWVAYATQLNEGFARDISRAVDWCNRLTRAVAQKELPKKGSKTLAFSKKMLRYEVMVYPYMDRPAEVRIRVSGIDRYTGWSKITPTLKQLGWEINEYANEVTYSVAY